VHQGLRELLSWVNSHRDERTVRLLPPAKSGELTELEQELGQSLPSDLRHVLGYFNGGKLPIAELLPGGVGPGTIGGATKSYAAHIGRDFLDPELLLPFAKTDEESLLAFDRSAGPVADTWPIVDYHPETGFHRLVYRTFDGFCRHAVAEWSSPDFGQPFTLDVYLRKGQRHIDAEPDVAAAHAALAHAERRAGLVERAIVSYLTAGRCTPPESWCDFEALKLAVLISDLSSAIEAGTRLVQPSPPERWKQRETTPGRVAEALGILARRANAASIVLRLLERLESSAGDELPIVKAVAASVAKGEPVVTRPVSETPVVAPSPDRNVYAQRLTDSYVGGQLRDEHMLFDPGLAPLRDAGWFGQLIHVRRDF
jgi:hypothetical protein